MNKNLKNNRNSILFLLFLLFHILNIKAQNIEKDNSKKIIGEWTLSKSKSISKNKNGISEEIQTVCNVCPKIKFTIEQNEVITNSTNKKEIYLWKITDNEISFFNVGSEKAIQRTFSKEYTLKFTQKEKFIELEFTDSKKNILILRR